MDLTLNKLLQDILNNEGGLRKNINPKVWGPPGWMFLEKVADSYPVKPKNIDKLRMVNFLTSLGYALPCKKCRANYIRFAMEYPPDKYVASSRKVKQWLRLYKRLNNK